MKIVGELVAVAICLAPCVTYAQEHAAKTSAPFWREAQPSTSETELDRLNRAMVQLADNARPAIVQIRVTGQDGKGAQSEPQSSRGTGFFIDAQGFLLTAQHVIDKAKEIEVRLANGDRMAAEVIAADSQIDLAILKIVSAQPMPILSFADSNTVRVGDLSLVFGYPFGRESSMSLGIVSRAGRSFADSASFDFIQTDAGAYAGGSGGPLLNRQGHVVGMITMASERGNMGFATPVNVIKKVLPRLVNGEKLAWGWLGVQLSDISLEEAKSLGVHPVKGVVIRSVLPGQPAARGGIQNQDVILAVNENDVDSPRDLRRLVGGLEAGKVVRLTIVRKGRTMQLSVPLGAKPETAKASDG